jgi:tripartite ATP-independent transporter DctM subunit
MSHEAIGACGLIALLSILTIGVPIAVAMGVVGAVGLSILLTPEAALIKGGVTAFDAVSSYELGVLPLFVLMAHLCFAAGATQKFFDAAAKFLGHRPGGLALAAIGGCAGFGAVSGSSLATAATVGLVALPEMRKHNYAPSLATGALAAGGTLGALVPPSAALIVYGVVAEQSIGKLFIAALIPGLTQALFYMATIYILCRLNPKLGPPIARASWRERAAACAGIFDLGALIALVTAGLALGWFTPTEAASIGVVGALVLCAARGCLSWATLEHALRRTLQTSGMIYAVIIAAFLFSTFISVSGIPAQLSHFVTGLHAGPIGAVTAMAAMLLVLGSFLDGMALMLLTTPIFLPLAVERGLSPIWFGIFLVRSMEIGFVHPPVGMNVYVIHEQARDIPLMTIFRGVVPFLAADFVHLALLIALPGLTLWLPTLLGM